VDAVIALILGFLSGVLLSAVGFAALARRNRNRLVQDVRNRMGVTLERRAIALGIPMDSPSAVGVGADGELEVRHGDELERLMRLAEAIENHEAAQLGYLDTMKVARDQVAAEIAARSGTQAKR
jgi:hypothetical protein